MALDRYRSVAIVLSRVLVLNLAVAFAKIAFGYLTGAVSILSDGFHSLTDSASNVVALVGVRAASKPPDADHPYGHRKYETLASAAIFLFLCLVVLEVLRTATARLRSGVSLDVSAASFAVMLGTLAVNVLVVRYEARAAARLSSEVLLADSRHTQSDVLTSIAVILALIGVEAGFPLFDPLAALFVGVFIGKAGYAIARTTSDILADRIVIAEEDLREVVMSVPEVIGCHHIRSRGSADHVFLDLHIWLDPETRLAHAHQISHVVKDRLLSRYPQIADAIIHIEPPPPSER
ncbi:MAG: cation transporter [Acidobacteria bacterium]|nr:cation transporter [Acidobacteriota bacterium]